MTHGTAMGSTALCRRSLVWLGVVTAISAASNSTSAQNLDEIIVTAERRETALQRTPISIAAFDTEAMELKGIETLDDIATFTPNLDIKGSRGFGNASPTYQIRGLSGGGGATAERSVALYVDGIFMPRTTGPFMNVLDIERVEVLRGPQGTLFGRNSTGGAIRVFTQQPDRERDGYLRMSAGDFDRADVNAMVNLPISDTVFFRAQAASLNQDGYVRRGSQELGGSEDTIGRLQLALEPNENLRVTFGLNSTESKSDGNPQDLETFDMRPDLNFQGNRADWISDFLQLAGQPRLDVLNDPRIVLDDFTMSDWCFLDDGDPDWDGSCEQTNEVEYEQFDVNVSWQLNDVWSLTSITGVSDFASAGRTDWVMLGTRVDPTNVESDVTYQELQLNADLADGRIELVTGVSYFDEESASDNATLERQGTSSFATQSPGTPPNAVASSALGPNGLFVTAATEVGQKTMSYGVFANLSWHITDKFTMTPGVRYGYDDKEVTQTRFLANDFTPAGGLPSTTVLAESDWNETDWRMTFDYAITDNHMVYLTSSKAFRAGAYSYNIVGLTPTTPVGADLSGAAQSAAIQAGLASAFTPPESVQNDEFGFRTEWFDRRLRLNITYFDMLYSDRQGAVQIADASSPTGFRIQVVDTGDVDLDGLELDGQYAVTDNFVLDFTAGSLDSFVHDPCANGGDYLFPGAVEESYSLGGRWSMPMERDRNLTISLSYGWIGEQQTHSGATALTCPGNPNANTAFDSRYELPDYGLWNGRVRYTSPDNRWGLTFFGNNLTDEVYGTFATRFGGGFWDGPTATGIAAPERSAIGVTRGRPREYGITFEYNFGNGGRAGE
jgi:iron complex outermembrane recepter protein